MTKSLPSQSILITGILLISINLRTSIASVGPLIPFIREDLGLSNGLAGFLTTLPLLTFATFSLFAPAIGKRLGMGRAIFLGISILTFGVILRVLGGIELLFLGTALTGIGIVIANVLLIPLIKFRLPEKLGLMTALLATMMSLFAAIAVGVSVPLAVDWDWGWRGSLASWALFMVIALLVWIPQIRRPKASLQQVTDPAKNVWKSKLAWQITIFMGSQSVMYFTLITWLPDMLIFRGWTPAQAGLVSSLMQVVSLFGSYFAPNFLIKLKEQTWVVLAVGIAYVFGYVALFIDNELITYVALAVVGFCMGSSLSIAYTLIALRTAEDQTTAKLSAMVQSSGYYLAALGPLLFGVSLDLFDNWNILIFFLLFFALVFTFFGMSAGRDRKI
ncbi:CynX/NimT family MFS transporter [Algoriphagus aquimarinus]|uniref:MFS transporter, CP family, cyanate transporter n=1 Tax=Algoriphagus aquimarinus TaxID=237018 RepID=A0A1I1CG62_9BACT|nr:MFS transporter [Algoriphagus aquimarinus]SFB61006.1 MFS transporter, CP family, cyanate transporter [Algoriphagus aquimarinus]